MTAVCRSVYRRFVDTVRNITRLSTFSSQYSLFHLISFRRLAIKSDISTIIAFQHVWQTFRNTSNQSFTVFMTTIAYSRGNWSRGLESEVWKSYAMRFRPNVLLTSHYRTGSTQFSSLEYLKLTSTINTSHADFHLTQFLYPY
jgi:hypothetical protein